MVDPIFWLGVSILFVAISLTATLVVALPALRELARAARSAEKLFDTLSRELPPTLEAIRLTGLEISDLTDDMSEGVQSASRVVKQVDQSVSGVKQQARKAQITTRSVWVGAKTAWQTFTRPDADPSSPYVDQPSAERLPPDSRPAVDFSQDHPNSQPQALEPSDRADTRETLQSEIPRSRSSSPTGSTADTPQLPSSAAPTAEPSRPDAP